MKKTLILTAFLSVLTFAAAQDTSGTSTDATSTDSTSMDMSGTSTDATSTDATSTDMSSTDATSTDATSTDTTSTDTSTDATSTDATSTDATSTDTTTTDTSTDATSTDATSTDSTSMDMSGTDTGMAAMSPADAYAQAQALASQADVAYPTPFYDRTLWKQSVDAAFMAHMGDMQNRDYAAYLAQLYTKTQWWINAYNAWKQLGDLTDQEKEWASLSAAKLAYISLMNGNKDQARQYVNDGMAWKDSPSLQSIMKRL